MWSCKRGVIKALARGLFSEGFSYLFLKPMPLIVPSFQEFFFALCFLLEKNSDITCCAPSRIQLGVPRGFGTPFDFPILNFC